MSFIRNSIIGVIFLLLLFVAHQKNEGVTQQEINEHLSAVEDPIFNATSLFNYTNPYDENFNATAMVGNIAHGLMYGFAIEANTILGASINLSWDYLNYDSMMFVLKIFIVLGIIWVIRMMFLPVVGSYVLLSDFSEEKNWNLKWYSKIGVVIAGWGLVLAVIVWWSVF